MREKGYADRRVRGEGAISAVSFGLFLVLVGVIVVINQNLWSNVRDFFNDFTTANVTNTQISLPVPATPAAHTAVYSATFQFALGIGILEILILAMRFTVGSRIRRKAQTVGSAVFWFGAVYLLNNLADMKITLAINQQRQMWFQFWAAIIILFGVSLVARAVFILVAKQMKPKQRST
ncbi:MAG: hypothetical protein ABSG33_05890 [Candidatus Bathyarchaeia archaeon]